MQSTLARFMKILVDACYVCWALWGVLLAIKVAMVIMTFDGVLWGLTIAAVLGIKRNW